MNRNNKNSDNAQVWIILIARFFVPIMVVLGVTIICIKDCADTTDPIDNAWAKVEHLCNLHVTDSTGEGFRVAYVTSKAVTPARLKEIESRKPIQDAMERLQKEAPQHFGGNLLETDIYDFAAFARKYDVDPILEIHCIFVMGHDKCNLYAGPNPKIPDSATFIDETTEQGVQWINHEDVYYRHLPSERIYRYWKCAFPYDTSRTDERFAHFSKSERLH